MRDICSRCWNDIASCTLGYRGQGLLSPEDCRRKAEEADELARKSTDFGARQAYEKIAQLWREMAERAEAGISPR